MNVYVIAGQSGAGISTALGALEDLNFTAVRGVPAQMLGSIAENAENDAAVSVRLRAQNDVAELLLQLNRLREDGHDCRVLYLEAEEQTLVNRYKFTRRPHPLAQGSCTTVQAIRMEKELLTLLRANADVTIDTTSLSARQLRETVLRIATGTNDNLLSVGAVSFGFKYGIPADADLVFDVRFLPNPYYIPELRGHTGVEQAVRDYVFRDGTADEYMEKLYDLIDFLLPQYQREGKAVLTIAVGCTGGRHRSVAVAQELYEHLNGKGIRAAVIHRDREKG